MSFLSHRLIVDWTFPMPYKRAMALICFVCLTLSSMDPPSFSNNACRRLSEIVAPLIPWQVYIRWFIGYVEHLWLEIGGGGCTFRLASGVHVQQTSPPVSVDVNPSQRVLGWEHVLQFHRIYKSIVWFQLSGQFMWDDHNCENLLDKDSFYHS